jgi:hypothetical protein
MKNKEEVITEMCIWYRSDYALRKEKTDPPWTLGMTEDDAKMLYNTIEILYNQYIEPVVKKNPNAFDKPKKNKSRSYKRKQQ